MMFASITRERAALLPVLALGSAFLLAGCSDSTHERSVAINPMAAYSSSTNTSGTPTNGVTQGVGAIDKPIVNIPYPSDGRSDHTNAPLLDNWHPGWQQANCLTCHTDQSRIPDHSYSDTTQCYLCHGTNGLPGFGDDVPPLIRGIVAAPAARTVSISWSTDEPCISRLIVRTQEGDRLDFPVSSEYQTSHRFVVNGLLPATKYIYEITAIDRANNTTTTSSIGQFSFNTLAAATP